MPVDRTLNMAVKSVEYHTDTLNRCGWHKLEGKDWWLVTYKGLVFAEMWQGKTAVYALIYTVITEANGNKRSTGLIIRDKSMRTVEMAIAGKLFNNRS